MKRWAKVISRVFDPVVEIPILLTAATVYAVSNGLRWRFLFLLLLVDAVLPAAYFLYGLHKKFISDWDITKNEERRGLYFFTVMAHLFGVVAAYAVGKQELFGILLIFWLLAVIFAGLTFFWKVSTHAGVNGALVAFFNHYYGWDRFWWLVVVLLVVLWARIEMKKHTWSQVIVGAGIAMAWVSVGLAVL